MKIAIIGYGKEGKSAHRFLKKRYPKAFFEIRDFKRQNERYCAGLDRFDMIVRSPGIPFLTPEIQRAKKNGVLVTSATKLFFQYCTGAVIGITGTKGKGTTASLLYRILNKDRRDAYLVGNIGFAALNALSTINKNSIVIYELSSFQLQDLNISPRIAVLTSFGPDHLDYHKSIQEYYRAKSNITKHQTKHDAVFFHAHDPIAHRIAQKSRGKKMPLKTNLALSVLSSDLRIPGFYNIQNAQLAASVAHYLGVTQSVIIKAIRSFPGLPYHLELIAEKNGIRYYNDSASTNLLSTKAAINAIDAPKILIMGGVDKGFDYRLLRTSLHKHNVRTIILYGSNRSIIKKAIIGIASRQNKKSSIPVFSFVYLADAFFHAHRRARRGDVILFSPASASFDQFKNAKERGAYFNALVKSLPITRHI